MKTLKFATLIAIYAILSPGFQCEKSPEVCDNFTRDTVLIDLSVTSNPLTVRQYDTLRFSSVIRDTITSLGGKKITGFSDPVRLGIQPYKVVTQGGATPELAYANIDFNPGLTTGTFILYGNNGYNVLYAKSPTKNELTGYLVAGRPGLYAIDVSPGGWGGYYFHVNHPECTSYYGQANINANAQNAQYWDSLGVSSLKLNGQEIITKGSRSFFFVKIIP